MGHKVNPVLFRSKYRKVDSQPSSIMPSQNSQLSHLLVQDIETKKFLYFLLRSRGIFLRSCTLKKTPEKLIVDLDLYFTSLFFKNSKVRWVKSFFKNMKKEEMDFRKIKEVKSFVVAHELSRGENKKKLKYVSRKSGFKARKKKAKLPFLSKSLKSSKVKKLDDFEVLYNRRLFYILCYKKKKELFLNKEDDQETICNVSQIHSKAGFNLVKTNLLKLSRFFGLRKLKYSFFSLGLNKFLNLRKRKQSLLDLNKFLCKLLQNYYGIEQVSLKMTSTQLFLFPLLKRQKKALIKKFSTFKRNRSLQKYFHETIELFYFTHVCFSKGNAFLLAKYIAYLLEKNRKQLMIVKFLRRCVKGFFVSLSKIPSKRKALKGKGKRKKLLIRKASRAPKRRKVGKFPPKTLLAIGGMRILIKGRLNKRRRTKKFLFSSGQFSLQTIDTNIDYYQTQANTLYGSFGIKVWIAKRK